VVDYRAMPYDGPVVVFRATEEPNAHEAVGRWASVATGDLEMYDVPGDHYTLLRPPNVATLAEALSRALDGARDRVLGRARDLVGAVAGDA
jgi:thioesterase domain-containing protein